MLQTCSIDPWTLSRIKIPHRTYHPQSHIRQPMITIVNPLRSSPSPFKMAHLVIKISKYYYPYHLLTIFFKKILFLFFLQNNLFSKHYLILDLCKNIIYKIQGKKLRVVYLCVVEECVVNAASSISRHQIKQEIEWKESRCSIRLPGLAKFAEIFLYEIH